MYESLRKLRDRRETGEGGFTLVELLIVIVILGILAAIVVLAIGGLAGTSKTAACNADTKTISTAEDAYYASPAPLGDNTSYGTFDQLVAAKLVKETAAELNAKFLLGGGLTATPAAWTLTGQGDCNGVNAASV
jgi:general secretion pathway protein G